jgi:hypothetical protein
MQAEAKTCRCSRYGLPSTQVGNAHIAPESGAVTDCLMLNGMAKGRRFWSACGTLTAGGISAIVSGDLTGKQLSSYESEELTREATLRT